MNAQYKNGDVVAYCPDCGALTTFESKQGGAQQGLIMQQGPFQRPDGRIYLHKRYQLLRCASCGRGGLATILTGGPPEELVSFSPLSAEPATLPKGTPDDIKAEVREAERCAAVGAWRAASAMLRSALEKTLKANGYAAASLAQKIDDAATDGIITAARAQRAHDEVRVLGNDVLHDAWRAVDETEYNLSHHYTQPIVEDFYDHRGETEAVLKAKGRIK